MQINSDDLLAALGYRPGIRHIDSVFTNPTIDTATVPETVAPIGGLLGFRAAAAVVEVVSTSAADTAAGTGARTVTLQGLDANWDEITETVALAGLTPVLSTKQFLRLNKCYVASAGSGKANAGDISIRDAGAGTERSRIVLGQSKPETGQFSVPRGHRLLATGWTVSARDNVGNKALADVAFYTTALGVRGIDWRMSVDGTLSTNIGSTHVFPEMSDIEIVVTRVNTNGTAVSVHGHGILIGPGNGL